MGEEVLGTLIDIFFVAYGVILVAGTTMTLVFLLALVRGRKMLAQWPFYRIVWSMTWMDAIYLAVQFPLMVAHDDDLVDLNRTIDESKAWYDLPVVHFALNVFRMIPPKGILYFSLLMALNRLAVFIQTPISPLFSKLFFSFLFLFREYVGWTTLGCWALILSLSVYTEILAPVYTFNRTSLSYEFAGPGVINSPFLHGINAISDYVIPFVIVVVYVVIYTAIRKRRMQTIGSTTSTTGPSSTLRTRSPDDRKLLFQAVIITFFLQLSNATTVLNALYDGNGWVEYLINILDLITSVLNHSVHSTIFLLSNPTIRSLLPRPNAADVRARFRCN